MVRRTSPSKFDEEVEVETASNRAVGHSKDKLKLTALTVNVADEDQGREENEEPRSSGRDESDNAYNFDAQWPQWPAFDADSSWDENDESALLSSKSFPSSSIATGLSALSPKQALSPTYSKPRMQKLTRKALVSPSKVLSPRAFTFQKLNEKAQSSNESRRTGTVFFDKQERKNLRTKVVRIVRKSAARILPMLVKRYLMLIRSHLNRRRTRTRRKETKRLEKKSKRRRKQ